jgi:hypothetical protein
MPETSEHRFASQADRAEEKFEALLNYISEFSEKPVYYAFESPPGIARQSGRFALHSMPIQNGRAILNELSLDKHGFELVRHDTSVSDFYDRNEVQRIYYPEVERLLKAATGASRVVIFDHQVRCLPMAQRGKEAPESMAK